MKGPAIFLAQFARTLADIAIGDLSTTRPEDGAREGAPFIRSHMIHTTTKAFDDFAASATDPNAHTHILGLNE